MSELERAKQVYADWYAHCEYSPDTPHPTELLIADIAEALRAARREGATQMRKRAAKAVEEMKSPDRGYLSLTLAAQAILRLDLEQP